MASTFFDRIAELRRRIPDKSVKATVKVDQIYAHYQHEGLDFEHPAGGQAKYLEQPWMGHATDFQRRFAKDLLSPEGVESAARGIALDGVTMVYEHAPLEFGDLKASGHATVEVDGVVKFDQPPAVGRLGKEDLKEKSKLHDLGLGNHYRGDWT